MEFELPPFLNGTFYVLLLWHNLSRFVFFLQSLLDPEPTRRPSARELCKHPVLKEKRTERLAAQLRRELNVEKFRTAMLEK